METNDLLSYLGYKPENFKSVDEFKSKFDEEFIRKSAATNDKEFIDKTFGKIIGGAETAAKKAVKELGLDIAGEELKDKKVDEVFKYLITKVAATKDEKIKELEDIAKAGSTEAVKVWEDKYGKLQAKFNDVQKLHTSTITEFADFQKKVDDEKKNWTIDSVKEKAWAGFKWANTADDLKKEGFKSLFDKNYKILLDETNTPYIADKSGNRIKSDKKQGEFKSYEEVLELEGIKNGVSAVAPDTGKQPARPATQTTGSVQQPGLPVRQVHPNAQRAAV